MILEQISRYGDCRQPAVGTATLPELTQELLAVFLRQW